MSKEIDERVVAMRFDNSNFEANVDTSIKTLKSLERALQLSDGTKGLENVDKAAKNIDFTPISIALDKASQGFSIMKVAAITAISEITKKLMGLGKSLVQTFAIRPLTTGFTEYGQKIDSTQVIMANTKRKAEEVAWALGELNTYADQTIYSFADMTQAVKKFSAAKVGLEDSVEAIKGLSNAAAMVGADKNNLFSAYYNIAQAFQLGHLEYRDWRSILQAGFGAQLQEQILKVAENMGVFENNAELAAKAHNDFMGSLSQKWVTKDILIAALQEFNKENTEVGKTAKAAATQIRSFAQMWDVLQEAVGTGWADTWTIIFGELEDAQKLWTGVKDAIEDVIDNINESRKTMLKSWEALGGARDLRDGIINLANSFKILGISVTEAVKNTFPDLDVELAYAAARFKALTTALGLTEDNSEKLTDALTLLFKPLRLIYNVVKFLIKGIAATVVIANAIIDVVVTLIANISYLPEIIDEIFGEGSYEKAAKALGSTLQALGRVFGALAAAMLMVLDTVGEPLLNAFFKIGGALGKVRDSLLIFLSKVLENENVLKAFQIILNGLALVITKVADAVAIAATLFGKFIDNLNLESKFNHLKTSGTSAGKDFVSGVINGLSSGFAKVSSAAIGLAQALISGFRGIFGIDAHSPAKTGISSGEDYGDGAVIGVEKSEKEVGKAGAELGNTLVESFDDVIENNAFDSGSNVVSILGQAIKSDYDSTIGPVIDNITNRIKEKSGEVKGELEDSETGFAKYGKKLLSFFEKLGSKIGDMVLNLNPQKVILFALFTSLIVLIISFSKFMLKLGDTMLGVVGTFARLAQSIGEVAIGLTTYLKALAKSELTKMRTDVFKSIALSVLMLAGAIALLAYTAKTNSDGLKTAAIIIGALVGAFIALSIVMTALSSKVKNTKDFVKTMASFGALSGLLHAFSSAVFKLAIAMRILNSVETDGIIKVGAAISTVMATLAGAVLAISKFSPQIAKGSLIFMTIAIAINIMAVAFIKLANAFEDLDGQSIALAAAVIGELAIGLIGVIMAFAVLSQNADNLAVLVNANSKLILALGAVLATFAISFAVLTNIAKNTDENTLSEVIGVFEKLLDTFTRLALIMAGFELITLVLVKVFKLSEAAIKTIAPSILLFSAALSVLILSVGASISMLMSQVNNGADFAYTVIFMGMLATILAELVAAIIAIALICKELSLSDIAQFSNIGVMIASMALVVGAISGSVIALSKTFDSLTNISSGVIAMLFVIASLLTVLMAIDYMCVEVQKSNVDERTLKSLVILTGAISAALVIITGSIAWLSTAIDALDDVSSVLYAIGGVLLVLGALGGLIKFMQTYSGLVDKYDLAMMAVLPLSVIPIAVAIKMLANTFRDSNFGQVAAPLAAITVILGSIGGMFKLIGDMSGNMNAAAVAALTVVCLMLLELIGAVVMLAYLFPDPWAIVPAVLGLSAMIVALGVMIGQFGKIPGNLNKRFVTALTVIVIGLGIFIGELIALSVIAKDNIAGVITAIAGITSVLVAFSVLINYLGKNGAKINKSEKIMSTMITITGSLVVLLGAIVGAVAIMQSLNQEYLIKEFSLLAGLIAVLGIVLFAISKWSGDTGKLLTSGIVIGIIATAFLQMAASVAILSAALDGADFTQLMVSLTALTATIAVIAVIANALGKAQQYALIGAAVLIALSAAFIAFGAAVNILSNSNLEKLAVGLAALRDQLIVDNVGATWGLIAAIIGLSVALALIAPAVLILSVSSIAFAGALYIVAAATSLVSENLVYLWDTSKKIFADILQHVELFGIALYGLCGTLLMLGVALIPLSITLPLVAGGMLLVGVAAMAFGVAVLSIGKAVELAANAIVLAKDAMIELLNSIINGADKFKDLIISLMVEFAKFAMMSRSIKQVAEAFMLIGQALLSIALGIVGVGAGLIVSAIGVLAMSGALKVLSIVMRSITPEEMANIVTLLWNLSNPVFAVGLLSIGIGALSAGIGLLALAGGITVMNNVINDLDWEHVKEILDYFINPDNLSYFTILGVTLAVVSAGLLAFSLSALVFSLAVVAMGGALKGANEAISDFADTCVYAFERIVDSIISLIEAISDLASEFSKAAVFTVQGFSNGINSNLNTFTTLGTKVASFFKSAFQGEMEIHSPSEWMKEMAGYIAEGFSDGMSNKQGVFKSLGVGVGNAFKKGFADNAKLDGVKGFLSGTGIADKAKAGLNAIFGKVGLEGLGEKVADFAKQCGLGTDGANDFADSLGNIGSAAGSAKGTLESMRDTIQSQMRMFEKFDMATDMTPEELLENMNSNLVGVRSWSEGIKTLGLRGMNAGLMQYLAEMGPQGYKYVEAFLDMTEDEFASANEMFAESMVLPDEATANVMDAYQMTGVKIVQAVSGGIGGSSQQIADTLGDGVENSDDECANAANEVGEDTAWVYIEAIGRTVTSGEFQRMLAGIADSTVYSLYKNSAVYLGQAMSLTDLQAGTWQKTMQGAIYQALNGGGWNSWLKGLGDTSGKFYIDGMSEGLSATAYINKCITAGRVLAARTDGAVTDYLQIHSPSRVAESNGKFYAMGFANGIGNNAGLAEDASEEMAKNSISSLSDVIKRIAEIFGMDMDDTFTITPVLDLSQIEAGSSQLDAMLSGYNASVAAQSYGDMRASADESLNKMQNMLDMANEKYAQSIASAIENSTQPVSVTVNLQGDAAGIFNLVKSENLKAVKADGVSPLMLMLRPN